MNSYVKRQARAFYWQMALIFNLFGWPLAAIGYIGQDAHWVWLACLGIGTGAIMLVPGIWAVARLEVYGE